MEIVALTFLYALCTGGKIRRILSYPIKGEWFIVAYIALQVGVRMLPVIHWIGPRAHSFIMLGLYFMLIYILWINRHLPGVSWMVGGSVLNLLALTCNEGRMPVHPKALLWAGQEDLWRLLSADRSTTHVLMNSSTRLMFLGDVIPTPDWWFYPRVLSVGDVVLVIGLCIFVLRGLKYGCKSEEN